MKLEDLKYKKVLFLGKSREFSQDELKSYLDIYDISVVEDDFEIIIEGVRLNPYEQNLIETLYEEKKYQFLTIEKLEESLAKEIDDDLLLMSLKLSHDILRLKSFLKNRYISHELFFKLLEMYNWKGEDFFDNDDNRDVTAILVARFYENIERNHNVEYATTGILHLINQTKNSKLLEVISKLEPTNNHKKIKQAIALNINTPTSVLKYFLDTNQYEIFEAISLNSSLDIEIVKELIKDKDLAKNIASNISLNDKLFNILLDYVTILASNKSLDEKMQKILLDKNSLDINLALSTNSNLTLNSIKFLLALKNSKISSNIYRCCKEIEVLKEGFKDKINHKSLSLNSTTPKYILEELYSYGDSDILSALAKNENTPIDILYQLQLDSRFQRDVNTNKAFGNHIQSENIGWLI